LLDDFFDDWSHFVPEDDDLSDEEFALVAFDKPVDNDPDAAVSKLEGTSEVVEDVGEDDASKCPSLVSKASSSDDDSSECPGLEHGKWRWGDDDSTDCNASYEENGADDDTTESSNCPPPLMKRGSVQGSSVSSSEVEADDLDDDDDWALWNKNGRDVRIDTLLMATDADESRDMIGECQGCGDLGIVGNFCAQCEDTGLIYEPRNNDESEKDGDEKEGFDWDAESKEYEFDESASSNSINHMSQLIQVKYVPKGLSREQRGWLYGEEKKYNVDTVEDLLIQLPIMVWMHQEETGELILSAEEQSQLIKGGLPFIKDNAVKEFLIAREDESQEDETALPVIEDETIDCEMALEACVNTPRLKRYNAGQNDEIQKNTWIADSGASTHMGNSDVGMTDVRKIDSAVQIGNGKTLRATKIGRKHMTVLSKDGKMTDIVLEDYKYIPDLCVNLFAITKCLRSGWKISNDGVTLYLRKGGSEVKFDKSIKTHKGLIIGVDMIPRIPDAANIASAPFARGKTVDIKDMHETFGHPSEDTTKRTAAFYGLKLKGELDPCVECAEGKSRQRDVKKESEVRSDKPGERIYIDQSKIKTKSLGGSNNWLLALDDCTDHAWSFFLKHKDHQMKVLIEFFKDLKAQGKPVKCVRCNNAGENLALEKACKEEGLGIIFKYTSPNSPQFNGRVERKFATLQTRSRVNLNGAKVTKKMRGLLWAECAQTSTVQENVFVTKSKPISSYEQFYGKEMPGMRYMKRFGEIGIVNYGASANKMKPKHLNRGRACLHLGRATNRPKDTYKFLNLETKKVIMSRDVTWIDMVYGDYQKLPHDEVARFEPEPDANDDSDSNSEEERDDAREPTVQFQLDEDNEESVSDPIDDYNEDDDFPQYDEDVDDGNPFDNTAVDEPDEMDTGPRNPKVEREMTRLTTYYNSGKALSRTRSGKTFESDSDSDDSDDDGSNDGGEIQDIAALILESLKQYEVPSSWVEIQEFAMNAVDLKRYESMERDKIPPNVYRDIFTSPSKFKDAWDHPDIWQ